MGFEEAGPLTFEGFSRKRLYLNQCIAEAGRDIDAWFERRPQPVPLAAFAHLQVLLKARRDFLEELAALDDQFLTLMLSAHGRD